MWERILFFKCGLSLFVVERLRCLSFLSALYSVCVGVVFWRGWILFVKLLIYLFIVSSLRLHCFASAFSHRRCLLEVHFCLSMGVVFHAEARRISGGGSFFSVGGEWM